MVTTRASRNSQDSASTPTEAPEQLVGEKRKIEDSPQQSSKREKTTEDNREKTQKTIEETLSGVQNGEKSADKEELSASKESNEANSQTPIEASSEKEARKGRENAQLEAKQVETTTDSAVKHSPREVSQNILEKGLVYFFFRGRVGIEDPSDTDEVARSYIVLRPLPVDAQLKATSVDSDQENYRVLALPKKVLPQSPRDRFMVFVEHASVKASFIKDNVLKASDYATQTAGTRHTPSATPIGEGVYAIVKDGRDTHLAYMLTLPSELGEVQKDIGLKTADSFVVSAKNPQYEGPSNTNLPKGPDFPQEILNDFRSLRWMPLQARLLDYENAQMLLIGSKSTQGVGEDPVPGAGENNSSPTELERLEGEDEIRAEALKGDNAIFADLALSHKEYSGVQTTW